MAVLTRDHASAHPDRLAVVDAGGGTSWATLDQRVNQLTHALRQQGLGEGSVVAALAGNQREVVELSLASLHAGLLLVPVNWHWTATEVAQVLADSGAAALLADERWSDVAAEAKAAVPGRCLGVATGTSPPDGFVSYSELMDASDPAEPAEQVRGGVMFYTSGTTGQPKGVKGALGQVGGAPEIWQLIAGGTAPLLHIADDPVQLVCGPIYHSAQWVFALFPSLLGAQLVLQHRFDAAVTLATIDQHQVTNTHLVPAQMVRLLRAPTEVRDAFDGSSLHHVHHGGAPCPPEVKQAMIDWWGPILTEYYGGTEGGFLTSIAAPEWRERPSSVGRPTPLVELHVMRDDGTPAAADEVGQVYFRNLLGTDFEYHNAPDKTRAAHLADGLGTLGDVGRIDQDGYLHLTDRKIDMIVSGGVNIYPAEIEAALAAHEAVLDVAVFGIPDDEMGERVMAVVQPVDGAATSELPSELEAHCRSRLAGYKCPRVWQLAAELPRTATGKLAKRALREPYWSTRDRRI